MDEDDVRFGSKHEFVLAAKQDMPDAEASKLVSESIRRFQTFRDSQQERIDYHQKMAIFHERELRVVDQFLATNFFEGKPMTKQSDETVKGNSRDTREPYER